MKAKKLSLILLISSVTIASILMTGCGSSTGSAETSAETIAETSSETSSDTSEAVSDDASSADSADVSSDSASSAAQPDGASKLVSSLYPLTSAEDATADGGYPVAFTKDDLVSSESGSSLKVEVFEYDRYELSDIDNLKPGDQITYCQNTIDVNTVEKDESTGFVLINGGEYEENGFELTEDDGLYRTVIENDYPVYYSVGYVTIPFSANLTFEDSSEDPTADYTVLEGTEALTALSSSETDFYPTNTEITVRGGEIVQIIRRWVP